jgi:phage terminase small subunit
MKPTPKCPRNLDACGRRTWRRLCSQLVEEGTVDEIDKLQLVMVCQLWSRLIKAEAGIAQFGSIIATRQSPIPKRSPYVAVANECVRQLSPLLARLRPSTRSPRRPSPAKTNRS